MGPDMPVRYNGQTGPREGGGSMSWFPAPGIARRRTVGWVDFLVLLAVLILLLGVVRLGSGMTAPLSRASSISLSPWALPLYAGESLLRIAIAYVFSLAFAVAYGYFAAKTTIGQRLLVPLLDILQSVPVLGFLSATIAFFAGLFPGSTAGLEIASVFAIFTAQAWNMAFSFYHSEMTLPRDLQEASHVYRLGGWQRLWYLELPSSAISLILNSMMSFGGSWFFLAASENVTYAGRSYLLPGVGSYMALAEQRGDAGAMVAAIIVMIILIVAVDQIFWRPVIAWSQRFKMEQTVSGDEPTSFVLTILHRSVLINLFGRKVLRPALEGMLAALSRPPRRPQARRNPLLWENLSTTSSIQSRTFEPLKDGSDFSSVTPAAGTAISKQNFLQSYQSSSSSGSSSTSSTKTNCMSTSLSAAGRMEYLS